MAKQMQMPDVSSNVDTMSQVSFNVSESTQQQDPIGRF